MIYRKNQQPVKNHKSRSVISQYCKTPNIRTIIKDWRAILYQWQIKRGFETYGKEACPGKQTKSRLPFPMRPSAKLVMSAIQADTYTKESTNTRARPPSAITCRRMAVTKNFRILKKCKNEWDCLMFEMLSIRDLKSTSNKQKDSISSKVF